MDNITVDPETLAAALALMDLFAGDSVGMAPDALEVPRVGTSLLSLGGTFADRDYASGELILAEKPILQQSQAIVSAENEILQPAFDTFFDSVRSLSDLELQELVKERSTFRNTSTWSLT